MTSSDSREPRDPEPLGPGSPGAEQAGDGPTPGERDSAYELLQRGQLLMSGRHHAQAAVVLERAAALEPGKGSILEPLGRAYAQSGQVDRAIETFTALVDVDPSSGYARYALARVLRRVGRLDEARTHLKVAVALEPTSDLFRGELQRASSARPGRSG
jgi:Flp pilus assembly protein TadD